MASIDRVMRLRSELEARLLRTSVLATILIASLGVGLGLLSGSTAIVFDGFFSGVDAVVTWLTLVVARLIPEGGSRRFQFGFWHLEPLVMGLKASVLVALVGYAFVASVTAIMQGGYAPDFGMALVYAALVSAICFSMWWWMRGQAERIDSGLVRLDVTAWLMSALITAALFLAFGAARLMEGTALAPWLPYVDPAILAILALLILPMPFREARQAFLEIFEVVPAELDASLCSAIGNVLNRHGFSSFETYVQKAGRALFVEISVLVPPDFAGPVAKVDALRVALADAIGAATEDWGPELWLTVTLTADRSQM
ncbi:MAG: cation diffusion facilitator family transporter [Thermaurantiacus sp.]